MDFKKQFEKKIGITLKDGLMLYNRKYIEWLEKQLSIDVVSNLRELLITYEKEYHTCSDEWAKEQVDEYLSDISN